MDSLIAAVAGGRLVGSAEGPVLVALDPGTRRAGVAVFVGGVAFGAADLLTNRASADLMHVELLAALAGLDPSEATLVTEWPRKYRTAKAAWADVEGLRTVARLVEEWGWARTHRVAPGVWGSTTPKHIRALRTGEALTPAERAAVDWDRLGPDAKDAIGLGKWALGPGKARLNKVKEDK